MASGQLICTNCGHTGKAKRVTKGSILIEIVLWCFFIVPGVIYSLWRLTTRYDACPQCGAPNMVPASSPRGKQLAASFAQQP